MNLRNFLFAAALFATVAPASAEVQCLEGQAVETTLKVDGGIGAYSAAEACAGRTAAVFRFYGLQREYPSAFEAQTAYDAVGTLLHRGHTAEDIAALVVFYLQNEEAQTAKDKKPDEPVKKKTIKALKPNL